MNDDTETPPTADSLGFWAVLEIMGHKRFAGFVTEVVVAGRGFVRIDVPAVPASSSRPAIAAYAKMFGTQALYGITPVDEPTARAMAGAVREQPVDQMLATVVKIERYERRVLAGEGPTPEGDEYDQRSSWEDE